MGLIGATELPGEIKVMAGALVPTHSERPQVFQLAWWSLVNEGETRGVGQLRASATKTIPMICCLWSNLKSPFALSPALSSEDR